MVRVVIRAGIRVVIRVCVRVGAPQLGDLHPGEVALQQRDLVGQLDAEVLRLRHSRHPAERDLRIYADMCGHGWACVDMCGHV
jgi:hypothetical protein